MSNLRCGKLLCAIGLLTSMTIWTAPASADVLFFENFEGYTSFPVQEPGYPTLINPGVPEITEGAGEFWYAARFESADSIGLNSDLAVGLNGGPGNPTKYGRVEDDGGLVLRIDTTDFEGVTLSFDWRTYLTDFGDSLVVGYYVGEPGFDPDTNRLAIMIGDWPDWTQLMSDASNTWQSEEFDLPDDAGVVYVAFWLNGGEGDYAKLDNFVISADGTVIPEPASLAVLGLGGVVMSMRRRA